MDKMIKSAGDQASEVALEVQQLVAKLIEVRRGIKGRQIYSWCWRVFPEGEVRSEGCLGFGTKFRGRSPYKSREQSPGGTKNVSCQLHFFRGKCTKGSDCKCGHQKSTYTLEWKKKFEEGPKCSNSSAEKPKNDGVCSFWKKGTCKKGKDCKFEELSTGREGFRR